MHKGYALAVVVALTLCLMLSAAASRAQNIYTVTNTDDSGAGSLRAGVSDPAATILFDIPKTDPGYDPVNGVWVIKPTLPYHVPAGRTIDGRTAREGGGVRPGIEIDGAILGQSGATGLYLNEGAVLRGLIVHSCGYGIWVSKSDVTISDCYIGTDAGGSFARPNTVDGVLFIHGATNGYVADNLISGNGSNGIRISGSATGNIAVFNNHIGTNRDGSAAIPNTFHGVWIHANAKGNFIEGNLISGNNFNGITISGDSTFSNNIRGNRIGVNSAGDAALGNGDVGIALESGSKHNLIEENLVSGNSNIGIHLKNAGTSFNLIRRNRVGSDAAGAAAIPNSNFGVALFNGPCNNVIGSGNIIAFNGKTGVLIDGSNSFSSTIGNTITQNSIFANGVSGIYNYRGGNGELAPPVLTAVSATQVSGATVPGQIVEVFADDNGQGQLFLGSTVADFAGNFVLTLSTPPTLPHITATTADYLSNTSAFSAPMATRIEASKGEDTAPRHYRLCRNHPNPFNPATVIESQLPRAAEIELAVYTLQGQKVTALHKGSRAAGTHRAVWDGCDDAGRPLPSGVYVYRLTTGEFTAVKKMLRVR